MEAAMDQSSENRRYERWRWQIFGITWLAYVGFYLTRKGFSAAKVVLGPGTAIGLSKPQMAAIDTAYNISYTVGQFVFGLAGDRLGTRRIILVTMFLSILAGAAMGFSATAFAFGVFFCIQGLLQSSGWAPLTKNMSYFFARPERGLMMGLWCTNYSLGGFLATNFAGSAGERFGWQFAFWAPAAGLVVVWVLFLLLQRDRPEDIGLPPIEEFRGGAATNVDRMAATTGVAAGNELRAANDVPASSSTGAVRETSAESWRAIVRVLGNPVVRLLCLVYFCIKPIRYLFLFWGPQYMHERLGTGMAASALLGSAFELGGPLGAFVGGFISDRVCGARRLPVPIVSLFALGALVYFFGDLPGDSWLLGGVLFVMGALLYAADSLVTGTSAVDFGTNRGASTAAGVINGCGSVGQIIGAALPGVVPASWGWSGIFTLLAGGAVVAGLIMVPRWNAVPDSQPVNKPDDQKNRQDRDKVSG